MLPYHEASILPFSPETENQLGGKYLQQNTAEICAPKSLQLANTLTAPRIII